MRLHSRLPSFRAFFTALVTTGLATAVGPLRAQPQPAAARPNIVFILVDDLGWSDLGVYGSSFYETPNIDRLAAGGLRFTQAYAACNVCSPSRASILTGRYPARVGITDWIEGRPDQPDQKLNRPPFLFHLPLEEVTFAEALHAEGYRTGFIGKWHLGDEPAYFPEHQGFDVNIAGCGLGHPPSYFSPYRIPNLPDGPPGEQLDERLTGEALKFIGDSQARQQPFLLYFCEYAVHGPLQARPEVVAKYEAKRAARTDQGPDFGNGIDGRVRLRQSHPTYAAMIESLDQSVGRVLKRLDELDLTKNTIVIFTSDNGGVATAEGWPTSNQPLRTGKGWAYEGGVREPLIASWPGHIAPGRTTDWIVTSPDFFPTLLDIAGLPARPELHVDGASFAPILTRTSAAAPERAIYWHYPHYSNQRGKPNGAVREGRWKLVEWYEDSRTELFDLSVDAAETKDLSHDHPEIVRQLVTKLDAWRKSVGARMPTPNPDYHAQP
jgi:arylsulfatase A-like enzyme